MFRLHVACNSVVSWRDRLRHATDSALAAGFNSVPRSRDGEFDGGRDAASAVEDRHRDGRFAAFEFVARRRDLRQPDDREFLAQDVGRGDGMRRERGQPGRDDTVDDAGGEKASSALPEAAACAGMTAVSGAFGVHAFGEPVGTRLQRQDV